MRSIKALAELLLDVLMQERDTNAAIIPILLLIIEFIEAEEEPEDPGRWILRFLWFLRSPCIRVASA
jgi:hypothetical protein